MNVCNNVGSLRLVRLDEFTGRDLEKSGAAEGLALSSIAPDAEVSVLLKHLVSFPVRVSQNSDALEGKHAGEAYQADDLNWLHFIVLKINKQEIV